MEEIKNGVAYFKRELSVIQRPLALAGGRWIVYKCGWEAVIFRL